MEVGATGPVTRSRSYDLSRFEPWGLHMEKNTWVYTEYVVAPDSETEEHVVRAGINPKLDYVEIGAVNKQGGILVRLTKTEFRSWLERCRSEMDKAQPNPADS